MDGALLSHPCSIDGSRITTTTTDAVKLTCIDATTPTLVVAKDNKNLRFSRALQEALREEIEEILSAHSNAQKVLEELAAALVRTDKPVRDPVAWDIYISKKPKVHTTFGGANKKEERERVASSV